MSFQLQHGASTLGFALDQRFFVVVDNRYDDVMLGPEFASKLITIVGYPKLGANKKNTYFRTPEEVLKYYYDFKYN